MMHDLSGAMPAPAILLAVLVSLHIVLSLTMLMLRHDGTTGKHASLYVETVVQRMSGILMIVALALHIISALSLKTDAPLTMLFILSHAFVTLFSMVHCAISVPKALVTLGALKNSKVYGVVRVVSYVLYGIVMILGLVASIVFAL